MKTALIGICIAGVMAFPAIAQEQDKPEESVKPGINEKFLDPKLKVDEWVNRFEVESREVYNARKAIVKAIGIKPGSKLADIGAGTGLFLKPFAHEVGKEGKVYSVDISEAFVKHLKNRVAKEKHENVEVVLCQEDSVSLAENSVDIAFICDTYHHFEYPMKTLASIRKALVPGGRLVVIDFERIPGVSREWLLTHVRAGKEVFRKEIEDAGFELVSETKMEVLKENYYLIFKNP